MTRLILARHATTSWNDPQHERLRGLAPLKLTPEGKKEADLLGKRLAALGIRRLVADDTVRARETADLASQHLPVPHLEDTALRPWDLGFLEGKAADPWRAVAERFIASPLVTPGGGEPYQRFFDRWDAAFWSYLRRCEQGDALALIVHSGHFATLDDVRLQRGITLSVDYQVEPTLIYEVTPTGGTPTVRELP